MTAPIPLDAPNDPPERQPGDFHRNHFGAPRVPRLDNPDKTTLYGRPSSFGKQLDNPFNLIRWKERMLVRGLVADLDDLEWHTWHELEDSDIDGIVARAYQTAGAHLAADRGTHIHLLTEIVDQGREVTFGDYEAGEALGIPTALQMRVVEQWQAFRAELGIEAIAIEQPIVNDELRLAGTCDRLDRATRGLDTALGTITGAYIGDIKTGKLDLDDRTGQPQHWLTYPLQLVAYRDGVPFDPDAGRWGERREWPETPHPGIAIIYSYDLARALDGEHVDWKAIPVDLTVGRKGAAIVADAQRWTKRTDRYAPAIDIKEQPCNTSTSAPTTTTPPTPPTPFSPSTNSTAGTGPSSQQPSSSPHDTDSTSPNAAISTTSSPEQNASSQPSTDRRTALRERRDRMHANACDTGWGDQFVAQYRAHNLGPHSTDDEIEAALDAIEPPFDPDPQPLQQRERAPDRPQSDKPDDGDPLDRNTLRTLTEHIVASPHVDLINGWIRQSADAGNTWSPKARGRVRHFEIARAALNLAEATDGHENYVRLLLEHVTDDTRPPVGVVLADLTIDEAKRATALAEAFGTRIHLIHTAEGQPRLDGPIADVLNAA